MKKSRSCFTLLTLALLFLFCLPLRTQAEELTTSGSCGTNLTWNYNTDTKTLTISGEGDMANYSPYTTSAPWSGYWAIESIVIEEGVTSISNYAFSGLSRVTSVVIPEGVTRIGNYAFSKCSGLTSVSFPSTLTSMVGSAFDACEGLETVSISNLAAWCEMNLLNFGNPLRYASELFVNGERVIDLVIPEGVTKIGSAVFYNCRWLRSVSIPESVTSIGQYAFSFCTTLESIEIPTAVTSIGENAFHYCSGLENVYYYCGSQEQWESVSIQGSNEPLLSAALEFHKWDDGEAVEEATDTTPGTSLYTCVCCGATKASETPLYDYYGCVGYTTEISVKSSSEALYALEGDGAEHITMVHTGSTSITIGSSGTYVRTYQLTFEQPGIYRFRIAQEGTGAVLSYTARIIPHEWSDSERVAPTCEEDGCDLSICLTCGVEQKENIVPATGHSYTSETVAPSCTEDGGTAYTCTLCGSSYFETETEATGHMVVVDAAVEPTCDWDGLTEGSHCYRCGEVFEFQETIDAYGHSYENGVCTRCGGENDQGNPFIDVAETDYFYDPVLWAVSNGITNGYGADNIFNPGGICTRGQVVTFLWRSEGQPEPETTENPFKDVAETDYFYKAVLWAVENGITNGYGAADIFNPDGDCTRGQVVTFLWRAQGCPDTGISENPFGDISDVDYFYLPVLWALEKGVTTGLTSTTFGPDDLCTRGQIVTFLYRAKN